jgi:hypothetical protein
VTPGCVAGVREVRHCKYMVMVLQTGGSSSLQDRVLCIHVSTAGEQHRLLQAPYPPPLPDCLSHLPHCSKGALFNLQGGCLDDGPLSPVLVCKGGGRHGQGC